MSDFTFGMYIFSAVHENKDTGVKYAADRLSVQYNQDFSKRVHRYALAGDPETCQARLKEYTDAGATTVFVSSACPQGYIDQNLKCWRRTSFRRSDNRRAEQPGAYCNFKKNHQISTSAVAPFRRGLR